MSNPICNEITIKCEKETFKKIAMILIDEEKGETTYNKLEDAFEKYNCCTEDE